MPVSLCPRVPVQRTSQLPESISVSHLKCVMHDRQLSPTEKMQGFVRASPRGSENPELRKSRESRTQRVQSSENPELRESRAQRIQSGASFSQRILVESLESFV
ncbi:unnamed protein product [Pleuronectes platessa]|uniref:Uncharacterized protein n=1 Tax=Pleuronectes platessa TaxID=8262 RepID=A0A9N7VDN1_PLEPL|nr:unnamed protein product [Pleuronectes platessa]